MFVWVEHSVCPVAALNCETVQSMAIPSGAPGSSVLQRAPVQDLRARNSAKTSEDPPASREFGAALLLAAVTDHGQIRDRHVTVLGVVFIHAVLFHLLLRVFLHPVGCGVCHHARNLDRMPDVFVEFDAVALDLPGAAAFCGKIVLVGILAFLKTARKRPAFSCGWSLLFPVR